MKSILLIFIFLPFLAKAQLLNINWETSLCQSTTLNDLLDLRTDEKGNTYHLLRMNSGTVFSKDFKDGGYALVKLNRKGEMIWVQKIGSTSLGAWGGKLILDGQGGIIVGGTYNGGFYLNETPLGDSAPDAAYSFILKLDSEGNLKYFLENECSFKAFISGMTADKDGNVYASATFSGEIKVGSYKFNSSDYNTALFKLDKQGNVLWAKHVSASVGQKVTLDHTANPITVFYPKENCPVQLVFSVNSDTSIFINSKAINNKTKEPNIIIELDRDGNYIRNISLRASVHTILAIGSKLYITGHFWDSLSTSKRNIASSGRNLYLGRLNEELEFENISVIARGGVTVTGMKFGPQTGVVISGHYADSVCFNNHSWQFTDGAINSFILNADNAIQLKQLWFVRGGQYVLSNIDVVGNDVFANATYFDICYFANDTVSSLNDTVSGVHGYHAIQTAPFLPVNWPSIYTKDKLNVTAFPMPLQDACTLYFDSPIYGYIYNIYNSNGQLCKNITVDVINSREVRINMNHYAAGVYILRMQNCCDEALTLKLIKM